MTPPGDDLAVADEDDESDVDDGYREQEGGVPFDLEAVEELVARVHRGCR